MNNAVCDSKHARVNNNMICDIGLNIDYKWVIFISTVEIIITKALYSTRGWLKIDTNRVDRGIKFKSHFHWKLGVVMMPALSSLGTKQVSKPQPPVTTKLSSPPVLRSCNQSWLIVIDHTTNLETVPRMARPVAWSIGQLPDRTVGQWRR